MKERQDLVLGAFWGVESVAAALRDRGLDREMASLGDVVEAYVAVLGLPGSLGEVGVRRDRFEKLADNSMEDAWIRTNPVPIESAPVVAAILNMASG